MKFILAVLCMVLPMAANSGGVALKASPPLDRFDPTHNATNQPNLSGIWLIDNYVLNTRPQSERLLKTIDGEKPPLQEWAAKLYQRRADDADAGRPYAPTVARCLPGGMPAMMLGDPYPFMIIQSPGLVTTIHMEEHAYRFIYLNESQADDPDPGFMGNSVGHWEGDTLVVDTAGLTDKTTMDFSGMPHTDRLRVTERIRRVKPDKLEDVLTFDDPGAFTKAWTLRRTYSLQKDRMTEYVCENQHNPVDAEGHSTYQSNH